jgi:hypothetical protein
MSNMKKKKEENKQPVFPPHQAAKLGEREKGRSPLPPAKVGEGRKAVGWMPSKG